MLVLSLSGLDYEKKEDLFKNAKASLRKFKGEHDSTSICYGVEESAAIKGEPTFVTENQYVFLVLPAGKYTLLIGWYVSTN